jgi:hypothetical protein
MNERNRRQLDPKIVALKQAGVQRALEMLSAAIKAGTLVRCPGPGTTRSLRKH